jgi:hypothetical protein
VELVGHPVKLKRDASWAKEKVDADLRRSISPEAPATAYSDGMPRLLSVTVLALATSLALVGCSLPAGPSEPDPGTTKSSEPDVAPATGETIVGDGYTFVAPAGWAAPKDFEKPAGIDVLVANLADVDGFADNVNVLLSPSGEVTPEQIESQGAAELEGAGATNVTVRDRVMVAGAESARISAVFTSGSTQYQIEQVYATRAGQTYVVTFSFSTTVSEADRSALTRSVLATWSWT